MKENLLYFELSAKTNLNVKKVFYTVIAELPFFEQYSNNKLKLITDLGKYFIKLYSIYIFMFLEDENNGSKVGEISSGRNPGINVKGKRKSNNDEKTNCSC
jgi:hypothetical protein